jgi:hypothetical protein
VTRSAAGRLKQAVLPVANPVDEFGVVASSVKTATFDYLAGIEWIVGRVNLCLAGPAGTVKWRRLVALGSAARVDAVHRVRYLTAADAPRAVHDFCAGSVSSR